MPQKCAGSSFWNINMFWFSQSPMILHRVLLVFELLVKQIKQFEHVSLGFGSLRWAFPTISDHVKSGQWIDLRENNKHTSIMKISVSHSPVLGQAEEKKRAMHLFHLMALCLGCIAIDFGRAAWQISFHFNVFIHKSSSYSTAGGIMKPSLWLYKVVINLRLISYAACWEISSCIVKWVFCCRTSVESCSRISF